jgi:ribosome-associated protein
MTTQKSSHISSHIKRRPAPASSSEEGKRDVAKLTKAIVDGLEDVKAQNLMVFDTEHLSSLFERVIVASGTSNRQTKALSMSVREAVSVAGFPKPRTEGEDNGEWIIVDCGAAVVHIMQPAIRQYYHLEDIWGEKPMRLKHAASEKEAEKAEKKAAEHFAAAKAKEKAEKSAAKAKKPAEAAIKKVASKTTAKTVGKAAPTAKKPAAKKSAPKASPQAVAKKAAASKAAAKKAPAKAPAKKAVAKKSA